MGNSVSNVVVGKPLVTGGILVAPLGTAFPGDATSALDPAFAPVGYITDSGVVKSEKRNTGTIAAWGGDTIAATKKGMDVTVKFEMAEFLNQLVQATIYGDANVQAFAATASIAAPVITLGTAASGGTFAAGTYYWKLTALNAAGETIGSNELTATLTLNQQQPINWTNIAAATGGYKLYRGTAPGAENKLIATIAAGTNTYTDTGTAGTTASVPTTNTTGRGNRLAVKGTSAPTPKKIWVFEIFSDAAKVRVVLPVARVMDVGDTTFKDDSVAAAAATLQAFPDTAQGYFYTYTDDGQTL